MEYQVMANPLGKSRDTENPYAKFELRVPDLGVVEHCILKTYKLPENEGEYATWYTAGRSEATDGSWEFGDMYKANFEEHHTLTYASPEFQKAYPKLMLNMMTGISA